MLFYITAVLPDCKTAISVHSPAARYKMGFITDSAVWLLMLKKRDTSMHIYDEDKIDEILLLIRDSFIPAFVVLEKTLRTKSEETNIGSL